MISKTGMTYWNSRSARKSRRTTISLNKQNNHNIIKYITYWSNSYYGRGRERQPESATKGDGTKCHQTILVIWTKSH